MSISSYPAGTKVRLKATFRDNSENLIDPAAVSFTYKLPGAVTVTKAYPADAEITRESLGVFHIDVQMDTPGQVRWRVNSTGTNIAAQQSQINIEPRYFG
jgi:hypothetical protein